jgi:hypothetical protein
MLRMSENRMPSTVLGHKMDELTECWRRLHNEEFHNLFSSPHNTVVIR